MRQWWKGVLLLILLGSAVNAAQFMFLERTFTIKGDYVPHADWAFYTGLWPEPWCTKNWMSPVNYYQGSYHLEAQIISMTNTANNNNFCIGWKNFTVEQDPQIPHNHTWEGKGNFKSPTTIIQDAALTDMWYGVDNGPTKGYADWNWTNAYGDFLYCYINPHGQDPFPVKINVKLYIISKGSSYKPFTQTVASPVATPGTGTLNSPTYVWLSCATSGASIYYSYPNTEPFTTTTLYDEPFKITSTKTLWARAYKNQYNASPKVVIDYTINTTDNTAPTVESATATSATNLRLAFSEPVHDKASPRTSNFTIDKGVTVTAAVIDKSTMKTIDLTTSTMATGNYTLTMSGVRDLAGNTVPAGTQIPFGYGTGTRDRAEPLTMDRPAIGVPSLVSQVLQVSFSQEQTESYTLDLYNAHGRLVRQAENRSSLDVDGLAKGIYFLSFESRIYSKTFKLIIAE